MADVGQEEDFEAAKAKALKIGASKCYVEDLRKEVNLVEVSKNDFFRSLSSHLTVHRRALLPSHCVQCNL